jgi:hypothetical protein
VQIGVVLRQVVETDIELRSFRLADLVMTAILDQLIDCRHETFPPFVPTHPGGAMGSFL